MKNKILKYWVLLLFVLQSCVYLLGVARVGSTVWGDSIYYYAYTRSIVMDGDLNFANESVEESLPFPNPPKVSQITGRVISNFSPGAGILWIPGFLIGQVFSFLFWLAGFPISLSGYSLVTEIFVVLTTVAFGTVGVYFFVQGLRNFFAPKIVVIATLSLLLTTQLLYYLTLDPLNSHSASFMLASIAFWTWATVWKNKRISLRQAVLLGSSLGFLALVRNQDVLTGIVLFASLSLRLRPFRFVPPHLFLAALIAVGVGSIQLATSWILFRSLQSPYILSGQSLEWFHPDFFRVLFSSGNGFFRYAPIAAISLFGLLSFAKVQNRLAICCLLIFLVQLYVIASWGPEIVGGPYGSRMFVGTLPFLGMGLAQVTQKMSFSWLLIGISLLFIWNLAQIGIMIVRW